MDIFALAMYLSGLEDLLSEESKLKGYMTLQEGLCLGEDELDCENEKLIHKNIELVHEELVLPEEVEWWER